MEPNEKQLLQELLALTKENNRMLRHMRRQVIIGRVMTVIYWLVMIGIAYGIYYFLQPYLKHMTELIQEANKVLGK